MNEKKFKKLCDKFFGFFDEFSQTYGEEFPIANGIDYYKWMDKKKIDDEIKDDLVDILYHVRSAFFTLGFVIGQSFEITYPDAKKDIEMVKRVIKEKGLLPYLPRVKAA